MTPVILKVKQCANFEICFRFRKVHYTHSMEGNLKRKDVSKSPGTSPSPKKCHLDKNDKNVKLDVSFHML